MPLMLLACSISGFASKLGCDLADLHLRLWRLWCLAPLVLGMIVVPGSVRADLNRTGVWGSSVSLEGSGSGLACLLEDQGPEH